jgi:hypothetical protein
MTLKLETICLCSLLGLSSCLGHKGINIVFQSMHEKIKPHIGQPLSFFFFFSNFPSPQLSGVSAISHKQKWTHNEINKIKWFCR